MLALAARTIVVGGWLLAAIAASAANPYEVEGDPIAATPLDEPVLALLKERGIEPAKVCSDAVFIRRVYLDVIGTLPEPQVVRAFLSDPSSGKRATLIEQLLVREEFADFWAMRWCDILRVKAEFPINLWPNAVQAYHQWIREAIRSNMPYDQFARALLTSSGSNFRDPPVNFYRAIQGREPAALAEAVALTFMGERYAQWPEARRKGMAAFFSRVAYKKTAEWKEEIVFMNPAPAGPVEAVFPNGKPITIDSDTDPRTVFADWLIRADNPAFTQCIANRMWFWLMGRGIVHEADDIRADNPPSNGELLGYLEKALVETHYDLRHLMRLILNSRTYQQSAIPRCDKPEAQSLFACYITRPMEAEVLMDALCWIGGTGEGYSSQIPEPFTFIPASQRTIALADGSITSSFLEMFGRPSRDTGLLSERNTQPTEAQRLFLLNSTDIQKRITQSARLRNAVATAKKNPQMIVRNIYTHILSRPPTQAEIAEALKYAKDGKMGVKEAAEDLAWALINSKEFLYRH